jgi:hypothetical protein
MLASASMGAAIVVVAAAPAVFAGDLFLRPPEACAADGDGSGYECADADGAPGAFNDWSTAEAAVGPGDVLRIDGEFTFTEINIFSRSGTEAEPLRLTAYDPASPPLLRADLETGPMYLLSDHVEIDHLRFSNAVGGCMAIGREPDDIHRGIRIHDNEFLRCHNGISVDYADGVAIHDNVLRNIGDRETNQGHCIYPAQGARDVDVYRNLCLAVDGVFASHCLHAYHDEPPGPAQDVSFHDNVCVGFTVGAGFYNGTSGIRVYGNVFVMLRGVGLTCRYGGTAAGAFVNNIVVGADYDGAFIGDPACDLVIDHNIYFRPDGELAFRLEAGAVDFAAWQELHDGASLLADPRLMNAEAGDVRLLPDSPAIDRGDNAFAGPTDYYGNARIADGVIDIGAAEVGAAAPPDGDGGPPDGPGADAGNAPDDPGGPGGPGDDPGAEGPEVNDAIGTCACRVGGAAATGRAAPPLALMAIGLALAILRRRARRAPRSPARR